MTVFGRYAAYYDALYADKDYERECDVLERLMVCAVGAGRRRILDAGCGTATHAVALARRGHQVTGVDRSADMLRIANAKSGGRVRLVSADIRTLALATTFDVVVCLFAVLSYQLSSKDTHAALRSFRRHLDVGGLLVCDFWHGPAVLAVGPAERVKVGHAGSHRIVRTAFPMGVDASSQTNTTRYTIAVSHRHRIVDKLEEVHTVRFFYPDEISSSVASAGFEVLQFFADWDISTVPTDHTWTGVMAARAI